MKKVLFLMFLMATTIGTSFAQRGKTMKADRPTKDGNRIEKVQTILEEAGYPMTEDQAVAVQDIYKNQKMAMRETRQEDREVMKEKRKAIVEQTKMKLSEVLSADQMAVLDKKFQEKKREKSMKKRAAVYGKINHTLEQAGVPLSEEQEEKIKGLMQEQMEAIQTVKEQTKDETAFKSEAKKIKEMYRGRIKSLLTKEQRAVLKEARGERKRSKE